MTNRNSPKYSHGTMETAVKLVTNTRKIRTQAGLTSDWLRNQLVCCDWTDQVTCLKPTNVEYHK